MHCFTLNRLRHLMQAIWFKLLQHSVLSGIRCKSMCLNLQNIREFTLSRCNTPDEYMVFIGSIVEFMRNRVITCINPDVYAIFVGSNVA